MLRKSSRNSSPQTTSSRTTPSKRFSNIESRYRQQVQASRGTTPIKSKKPLPSGQSSVTSSTWSASKPVSRSTSRATASTITSSASQKRLGTPSKFKNEIPKTSNFGEKTPKIDGANEDGHRSLRAEIREFDNLQSMLNQWVLINLMAKETYKEQELEAQKQLTDRWTVLMKTKQMANDTKLKLNISEQIKMMNDTLALEYALLSKIQSSVLGHQRNVVDFDHGLQNVLNRVLLNDGISVTPHLYAESLTRAAAVLDQMEGDLKGDLDAKNQVQDRFMESLEAMQEERRLISELNRKLGTFIKQKNRVESNLIDKIQQKRKSHLDEMATTVDQDLLDTI